MKTKKPQNDGFHQGVVDCYDSCWWMIKYGKMTTVTEKSQWLRSSWNPPPAPSLLSRLAVLGCSWDSRCWLELLVVDMLLLLLLLIPDIHLHFLNLCVSADSVVMFYQMTSSAQVRCWAIELWWLFGCSLKFLILSRKRDDPEIPVRFLGDGWRFPTKIYCYKFKEFHKIQLRNVLVWCTDILMLIVLISIFTVIIFSL